MQPYAACKCNCRLLLCGDCVPSDENYAEAVVSFSVVYAGELLIAINRSFYQNVEVEKRMMVLLSNCLVPNLRKNLGANSTVTLAKF